MLGVKLRSEKASQYDALGERGQAVYQVASQLLTTLERRRTDLAQHFAVPQLNEDGTRIDWYAPRPGAVVAWQAATPSEQAAAMARLDALRTDIEALRASTQDANGSSSHLFGQLLKWVLHYPDPSHVYLVDGQPIITFWGFRSLDTGLGMQPLHARASVTEPPAAAPPPASVSLADTVPEPVTPVAQLPVRETSWWRRWWFWLLLLPLLALLVLFGLRACMPTVKIPVALPNVGLPSVDPVLPGTVPTMSGSIGGGSTSTAATAGAPHPAPAAGLGAPVSDPAAAQPGTPSAAPPAPVEPPAPAPVEPGIPPSADANPASSPDSQPPPELSGPSSPQPPGEPLTLPPQAADGKADFLNGDWRVRAGIQDRNTGEPLRLQYQFKEGQGHVTVNRHNGVRCQAPVSAAVVGGALNITSSAAAACNDGSTYDMPAIRCKSGEQAVAACMGHYGQEQFPLTMRQAQP